MVVSKSKTPDTVDRTVILTNIKYTKETEDKLAAERKARQDAADRKHKEEINALTAELVGLTRQFEEYVKAHEDEMSNASGLLAYVNDQVDDYDEKIEEMRDEIADKTAELEITKKENVWVSLGDAYLPSTTSVLLHDVDPTDIDLLSRCDEIKKKAEDFLGYSIESFNYKTKYVQPLIQNGWTRMNISTKTSEEDPIVDQVNYNGTSFSVWKSSDMYYTIIAGKRANICDAREDYRDRIKLVVDSNLNLIHAFDNTAKLIYFQNGKHKDIKLIDGDRTLKVFLTTGIGKVDEAKIIQQSKMALNKYRKAELK